MFHSLFLKTDVTAVRIWKNFILASVGGFVNIYQLDSNKLMLKKEIFEGQKIYGFEANLDGTKFIIYGGKNIAHVHNINDFKELKIIKSDILSDWILDAKWIENDTKIVTVLMHNKVTIFTENIISEKSFKCEERCILYSAHICYSNYNELIVFSGTVFSEILLWKPYYKSEGGLSPVLKRLKQHKGVIFSLHYDLDKGLLCSTSDDRSAILWKVNNKELLRNLNSTNSDQLEVLSCCQVYGHLSRVFRSFILTNVFVTAGEDSLLIIWNFEGKMLRKIDTHQGGPIWSLDYDLTSDIVCTGGNDGGVSLIKMNHNNLTYKVSLPNAEIPRIIGILQQGNMVCLSDTAAVYYYHKASKHWDKVARHSDLENYSILQVSPCKEMVALVGFEGQIYIYYHKNNTLKQMYTHNLKRKTRIFSFHWLNCKTFLVCQDEGKLHLCFLYEQKINMIQTFILPQSKESWSTSATFINNNIIVGDRKGNIYNFTLGKQSLINSLKKCHSYLGITKLYTNNDTVISLGKDGILKRFKLFNGFLECIDSNKTKFSWLASLENNFLLSFSGDNFVISDCRLQRVLYETQCGGGHRSWDYLINSGTFTFCFIQHKVLNVVEFSLEDVMPRDVSSGYHAHEINSLKVIEFNKTHILISGGEDTLLRISALKNDCNLEVLESLKVHLSSIRSIFLHRLAETNAVGEEIEYFLFTAGGRAQIICWHFNVEVNNLGTMSISCSEKYNFYEPLCQDKVETRIMDLSVVETTGKIILFSGCSDGSIKVFSVSDKMELKFQKSIFSMIHSIMKMVNVLILFKPLLLSMYTDGSIVFWDVLDLLSGDNLFPFGSYKIHQSGINSYSYKVVHNNRMLFLSGGDDNSVILTLFKFSKVENKMSVAKLSSFEDKLIHCAQITGVYLEEEYFVTSSIDQRIAVWRWANVDENITFQYLQKYVTTVADPQGLECFVRDGVLNLFVYGVGIEHLIIKIDDEHWLKSYGYKEIWMNRIK